MRTESKAAQMMMLMAESIPVRIISEPLVSHDKMEPYGDAVIGMRAAQFDVAGVVDRVGNVLGYIDVKGRLSGTCGDKNHIHLLDPGSVVTDAMPIAEAGSLIARKRHVFVLERNKVTSIVTRADLQKAPVRMMIFGVITVLEMHLTDVLRREWPGDEWSKCGSFTPKQVKAIESAFQQARTRNDETDILGCMDLYDKSLLAGETASLFEVLRINGPDDLESSDLADIRRLRNAVAHGKSLVTSNRSWNKVLQITIEAHKMSRVLEAVLEDSTANGCSQTGTSEEL